MHVIHVHSCHSCLRGDKSELIDFRVLESIKDNGISHFSDSSRTYPYSNYFLIIIIRIVFIQKKPAS